MEPVSWRLGFAPPATPLKRRLLVYFRSGAYNHRGIKRRVNASQGISIVRRSLAYDSRLRGCAHDPERPREVVGERGCLWADSVHPGNPRIEKQIIDTGGLGERLDSSAESYLQHIRFRRGFLIERRLAVSSS
jgi:hypothetical protein